MFALVAILGTGLAVCAGEAIAIDRHPARRPQCAGCHASPMTSNHNAPLGEVSCEEPAHLRFAIVVDVRTGERALVGYSACMPMPLSVDHGR